MSHQLPENLLPVADWWRPRHPVRGFRRGRHARWQRHLAASSRPHHSAFGHYGLEPLEPRFLLNGELSSLTGSAEAFGDMAFDAAEGLLSFGEKLEEVIATLDEEFAGLPGMLTQRHTDVDEDGNVLEQETRPPKIADLLSYSVPVDPTTQENGDLGTLFDHGQTFDDVTADGLVGLAQRADYLYGQPVGFWAGPAEDTILPTLDLDGDGSAEWREAYDVLFVGSMLSVLDDFAAGFLSTAGVDDALEARIGAVGQIDFFTNSFSPHPVYNDLLDFGGFKIFFDTGDDYLLSMGGTLELNFAHTFDIDFGIVAEQLGIEARSDHFDEGDDLQATEAATQPEIDLDAGLEIPLFFSFFLPEVGDEVGDELSQQDYDEDYYDSFALRAGSTFENDPIQLVISADQDLSDLFVNVGFLGLQGEEGSTFTLDIAHDIEIAGLPSSLGFTGNLPLESSDGVLTAQKGIDEIDYPVEFELIFQLVTEGGGTDETSPEEVTVDPSSDPEQALNDALGAAGLDELLLADTFGAQDRLRLSLREDNSGALDPRFDGGSSTIIFDITDDQLAGDFSAAFLFSVGGALPQRVVVNSDEVEDVEDLVQQLNTELGGVFVSEIEDDDENAVGVSLTTFGFSTLYLVDEFTIDADRLIGLDDLTTTNATDIFTLLPANDASFELDLSLEVLEGLERTTGDWGDDIEIAFGSDDLYGLTDASLITDVSGFKRFDYRQELDPDHRQNLIDGLTQEVVDFNEVGANSVIGMLSQLRSWANRVAESLYLGDLDVPFADLVLGEVLGFDTLVGETLLFDEIGAEAEDFDPESNSDLAAVSRLIGQVIIDGNTETVVPFTNAQELAARLAHLGLLDTTEFEDGTLQFSEDGEAVIWYDPADPEAHDPANPKLLVPLTLNRLDETRLSMAESAVDFLQRAAEEEGGATSLLGPLELNSSGSTVELSASETMNVTLGILLGEGGILHQNPPLSGDDDNALGVTPLDDEALAVTGGGEVNRVTGRLSGDAFFQIRLEGGDWVGVTVAKEATDDNTTVAALAMDINDALADASIGGITAMAVHDRIVLVADDSVAAFDVQAFSSNNAYQEIGLASSRASNVSLALATEPNYELAGNGTLTITLNGDEDIELELPASATDDNTNLTNLVDDLNALLASQGEDDRVIFSRSGNTLILGSIAEGVHYLEVVFDGEFADLFGSVGGTTAEAGLLLEAGGEILNHYGDISDDATIGIDYGADTVTISVDSDETDGLSVRSIRDLADLLNNRLADEGVTEIEFVALGAKRLGIKSLHDSVSEITITNAGAGPLGFADGDGVDGTVRLAGANPVAHYFGLEGTATATFDITYDDGDGDATAAISLAADETLQARTLYDLQRVLQEKVDAAISTMDGDRLIVVGIDNGRLIFTAAEDENGDPLLASFSISAADSEAEAELGLTQIGGLGNLAANSDDLLIRTRDGSIFTVDLMDADGDINAAIDRIQDAADAALGAGQFEIRIADDNASLLVIDDTGGSGVFEIDTINGSLVARQLGIFSAGSDVRQAGVEPNVILGDRIGVPTLSDRLSIEDDGRMLFEAELMLGFNSEAPPDFSAEANLGFVGIGLSATAPALKASFSMDLTEPQSGSGYTLSELFNAARAGDLADLAELIEAPEIDIDLEEGDGDIVFTVSVLGGGSAFESIGLDDGEIVVRLEEFGATFAGELPAIEIGHYTTANDPTTFEAFDSFEQAFETLLGDLGSFAALDFSTFAAALESLIAVVEGFSEVDFLDLEIPIIGVSILDMVGIADDFIDGIQEILDNPVATLQELEGRLAEALGLPDDAIGMAIEEISGSDNLILEFDFSRAFSEPLNIELDLMELVGQEFFDDIDGFNLDAFGLYGAAGLAVSGAIDAKLSFGIDLDSALDGEGNPQEPEVALLYGEGHTNLAGNLTATGSDMTFNAALGPLGATVRDGVAQLGIEFDLFGEEEGSLDLLDLDPGGDFLEDHFPGLVPTFSGSAEATLPVNFPTSSSYLGDILLGAALSLDSEGKLSLEGNLDDDALLAFSEGFFDDLDFANIDIFSSLPLLIDGFDLFLANLQGMMQGQVLGVEIPFLGNALGDSAQVLEDFRQDFVQPFREQVEETPQRGLEIVQDLVFRSLWATTVLVKLDESAPDQDLVDLGFDLFDNGVALGDLGAWSAMGIEVGRYVHAEQTGDGLQWNFVLGGEWQPDVPLNFDLGFPALGLELDVDPEVILEWNLGLGFGLDSNEGAYFDVSRVDYEIDGNDVTEVEDSALAEFGARAELAFGPTDTLTGRLAFLELEISPTGDAFAVIDGQRELVGTGVFADFQVDLVNTGGDDTVAFFELGDLDAEVTLEAGARLDVQGLLQFNDDLLPAGSIAPLLPSIQADFVFDWGNTGSLNGLALPPLIDGDFASGISFNFADSLNEIAFNNVQLNVGSFLSDLVGPILGQIQEVTGPLEPIIEVITAPIPVVSDLAGKPVTLVDLAATFGEFDPGFIYAIADIIQLVNTIGGLDGEEAYIAIGSFSVFDRVETSAVSGSQLASGGFDLSGAWGEGEAFLDGVGDFLDDFSDDFAGLLGDGGAEGTTKQLLTSGFGEGGGFDFPILSDPAQIFGLLIGRPAVLVTYDMPPFVLDFEYEQKFPVYGPIFAVITVGLGFKADFAFGYDTQGFMDFSDGDFQNPLDLLAGFYVSDRENPDGSGADVPELVLTGEVFAGAEVNLGVASAGVEGGIILTVNFDLYDPDRDGRVRLSEMLNTILFEFRNGDPALAPVAIFDISGNVAAQLRAFIEILFLEFELDITPPIVLFEFEVPFDREPILGDVTGDGTLILNIGDSASLRQEGDTRDIGEEIFVKQSGDQVQVWSPQFGVGEGGAQIYEGVSRILVRGGEGDDLIDLSGVTSIAAEVYGGEGNDTIRLGGGDDLVYGGLGHDVIEVVEGGDNIIIGGRGDDDIQGGSGNDLIFGGVVFLNGDAPLWTDWTRLRFTAGYAEDGNNRIHTGNGQNLVIAGGGHDTVIGGDGADTIYADGGFFDLSRSSPWSVDAAEYLDLGVGGNDYVFGGVGDDEIHGGPGDDVLKGGVGDDTLFGNKGFDILFGDGSPFDKDDVLTDDDDFEFDVAGNLEAIQWAFDETYDHGNDTLHGGTENDLIFGGFGNSVIDGEQGSDLIFGDGGRVEYTADGIPIHIHSLIDPDPDAASVVSGSNTLSGGGQGGNIIFGGAGVDNILGGDGPDIVFGGDGDDIIDGAKGSDVLFGDTGLVAYRNYAGEGVHRRIGDEDLPAGIFDGDDFDDNPLSLDLIITDPDEAADAAGAVGAGSDIVVGGQDDDIVLGGGGGDFLYGDWEVDPFGPDPDSAPQGSDIVIGDWGRLDFVARRVTIIESLFAGDGVGGDDTLYGNGGDDVLIGGSGGDTLHGVNGGELDGDTFIPRLVDVIVGYDQDTGEPITETATGDDIAIGDNARLTFAPALNLHPEGAALVTFGGYLVKAETTDTRNATGGEDTLFGDLGSNTLIGGAEGDDIYGAEGNDIVLGDNGEVVFGTVILTDMVDEAEKLFVFLERVESVVTEDDDLVDGFVGGSDTILGFTGTEIALGGIAGDIIDGHEGDDILLGDNGLVQLIPSRADEHQGTPGWQIDLAAPGALAFLAGVVERIVTSDVENASGGEDIISGGEHSDIILGGAEGDTLYGDSDVPLGPEQVVGDNLILGDNGELLFDTDNPDWVFLTLVHTALGGIDNDDSLADKPADPADFVGGADLIYAGDGEDIALGGLDGDEIHGQEGDDILLGDNGQLNFLSGAEWSGDVEKLGGVLAILETTDEADPEGGQDLVLAGDGDDIVLGGVLGDLLFGETGEDVLLGDQGRLEWNEQEGNETYRILDLITTTNPTLGGRDLIDGGADNDAMFGGTDSDLLFGGSGDDLMFGDHGELLPQENTYGVGHAHNFFAIDTGAEDGGAGDLMFGGDDDDIMLGQQGNDAMYGGAGDDDMIGGHNVEGGIDWLGTPTQVVTSELDWDKRSHPDWPDNDDPRFNDLMDGGSGSDVMLGDNGTIWRRDATTSERHYQLNGETIHLMPGVGEEPDTLSGYPDLDLGSQGTDPNWSFGRLITLLDHDHAIQDAGGADRTFGDDAMAGGADGDMLFGSLGDDVIQGDGSLEILDPFGLGDLLVLWELDATSGWQPETLTTLGDLVDGLETNDIDPLRDSGEAGPQAFDLQMGDGQLNEVDNPLLALRFNIIERASDDDDYIEGNGGSDLLYGGLGQDDIIGGSSALYGLVTAEQRPDSGDEIYGGAGERLARNEFVGVDDDLIEWQDRHARDADVILGDNANVFRLIDGNNDPLAFNFDTSRDLVPDHYPDEGANFQLRQFAPGVELADAQDAWYVANWLLIQARGFELLDYAAGEGDTYDGPGEGNNSGDDLIHGESGDDLIHGMAGHDAIFGNSEDDHITGGTGNDWISGGSGEDGVIGDDGLVLPSRNGQAEPLYGIEAIEELDKTISTPGNIQQALINQSHELKLAVRLFSFPGEGGATLAAEGNDIIFGGLGNDWLHGGAGDDAVSGAEALPGYYDGSLNWLLVRQHELWGIDAQVSWYADRAPINPGDILQYEGRRPGTGEFSLYDEHDPWRRVMLGSDGEWLKDAVWVDSQAEAEAIIEGWLGSETDLDENDPAVVEYYRDLMVQFEFEGEGVKWLFGVDPGDPERDLAGDTQDGVDLIPLFDFLLNFDPLEGIIDTRFEEGLATDGDDRIFGDLGHDWLAGGTGRDHMYGGRGDDMLNMDDDHGSNFGDISGQNTHPHFDADDALANNLPDAYQSYADIVYGGAGRDRLILNTGADRAIDWVGEFNSYVVPFSPFGAFHISRSLQPHLQEFLYELSESDGADQWAPDHERFDDHFNQDGRIDLLDERAERNYEPYGELGLVLQQDFDWNEQTGAPDDPQPGNFQGRREIMRRELFHGDETPGGGGPNATAFAVEAGDWSMGGGLYTATAELNQEAVSILHLQDAQPTYLEILVDVSVDKDKAGVGSNAYILFDYQDADDFKFAGIDQSTNKLQIGQRTASGWEVLSQVNLKLWHDTLYTLGLVLNGTIATIVIDGQHESSYAFSDALNDGYLALGANNSVAHFSNFQVQKLPPLTTHEEVWDFEGTEHGLTEELGDWQLAAGWLNGQAGAVPAMLFGDLPLGVGPYAALELETRLLAEGRSGLVYNYLAADDYKFALLDAEAGLLMLGHVIGNALEIDASLAVELQDGEAYDLKLTLTGGQALVALKPAAAEDTESAWQIMGEVYYSLLNAGQWGLMVDANGEADFAHLEARTNDIAYLDDAEALMASATPSGTGNGVTVPTPAQVEGVAMEAWARMWEAFGASSLDFDIDDIQIEIADLGDGRLALADGLTILIDGGAAGHGWFVDPTPWNDDAFRRGLEDGVLLAVPSSEAHGRIDLLTVLMHEIGHLMGLDHLEATGEGYQLMHEALPTGMRILPDGVMAHPDEEAVDSPLSGELPPQADRDTAPQGLALGHELLLFDLRGGGLRDMLPEEAPPVAAPPQELPSQAEPEAMVASPVLEGGDDDEASMTFDSLSSQALSKPLSLLGKFGSRLR
ncbi:hypothetical protein [Halomonas sp. H5]|uniref:hypothetical protein n=1 Tax=Halomonas sp. H5 TaxID=3423910 RepID=UPI003D3667D8